MIPLLSLIFHKDDMINKAKDMYKGLQEKRGFYHVASLYNKTNDIDNLKIICGKYNHYDKLNKQSTISKIAQTVLLNKKFCKTSQDFPSKLNSKAYDALSSNKMLDFIDGAIILNEQKLINKSFINENIQAFKDSKTGLFSERKKGKGDFYSQIRALEFLEDVQISISPLTVIQIFEQLIHSEKPSAAEIGAFVSYINTRGIDVDSDLIVKAADIMFESEESRPLDQLYKTLGILDMESGSIRPLYVDIISNTFINKNSDDLLLIQAHDVFGNLVEGSMSVVSTKHQSNRPTRLNTTLVYSESQKAFVFRYNGKDLLNGNHTISVRFDPSDKGYITDEVFQIKVIVGCPMGISKITGKSHRGKELFWTASNGHIKTSKDYTLSVGFTLPVHNIESGVGVLSNGLFTTKSDIVRQKKSGRFAVNFQPEQMKYFPSGNYSVDVVVEHPSFFTLFKEILSVEFEGLSNELDYFSDTDWDFQEPVEVPSSLITEIFTYSMFVPLFVLMLLLVKNGANCGLFPQGSIAFLSLLAVTGFGGLLIYFIEFWRRIFFVDAIKTLLVIIPILLLLFRFALIGRIQMIKKTN